MCPMNRMSARGNTAIGGNACPVDICSTIRGQIDNEIGNHVGLRHRASGHVALHQLGLSICRKLIRSHAGQHATGRYRIDADRFLDFLQAIGWKHLPARVGTLPSASAPIQSARPA